MAGIIVSIPPTVEVPPGNNASNPSSLPPVTYQYALLSVPQTWTATQAFAAIQATSVSSPIYSASGAMTFQSNGSTFAGNITAGQQFYFGTNNVVPATGPILTVSKNAATPPAIGTPGGIGGTAQILLSLAGNDTNAADITIQSFNNTAGGIRYLSAAGTAAASTATAGAGGTIGANFAYSYTGSVYVASSGFIFTNTEAAVSGAASGGRVDIFGTPTGTTGVAVGASVGAGLMVGDQTDPGAGNATATGSIKSKGATSGIGYATGAGGPVTQITSRTTGVTINKVCGAITLFSAAGSATPATFTVTNSAVAATDVVICSQKSGADKYEIFVTAVAAGSFNITFFTTGGTTTEQPVFNFAVIKAVAN